MSMLKPDTCLKYMSLKSYYIDQLNINPYIVEVHKCLVSNSIDMCSKYFFFFNLKLILCHYY